MLTLRQISLVFQAAYRDTLAGGLRGEKTKFYRSRQLCARPSRSAHAASSRLMILDCFTYLHARQEAGRLVTSKVLARMEIARLCSLGIEGT